MLYGPLCVLRSGGADNVLQLLIHHIHPLVEGARKVSSSVATVATFWLALAKAGRYPPPLHGDAVWLARSQWLPALR
jgi:hypothetical protein